MFEAIKFQPEAQLQLITRKGDFYFLLVFIHILITSFLFLPVLEIYRGVFTPALLIDKKSPSYIEL